MSNQFSCRNLKPMAFLVTFSKHFASTTNCDSSKTLPRADGEQCHLVQKDITSSISQSNNNSCFTAPTHSCCNKVFRYQLFPVLVFSPNVSPEDNLCLIYKLKEEPREILKNNLS